MNEKKAKAIRRNLRMSGLNPSETIHDFPGTHDRLISFAPPRVVQIINPIKLSKRCGRFAYKIEKRLAA